jgi:glycosyltransferase involved in cell wall biosynthesis
MMNPSISVILPVYNGGSFLKLSVESVLAQAEADFEFLILDDYSTDGSREYVESIDDVRVKKYLNQSNKGLFWNLNFLAAEAKAPLVKLWAQDDVMYAGCLSSFVNFHAQHIEVGFSYCKVRYIDDTGSIIRPVWDDPTPEIISAEEHANICFITGSIAGNIANTCITKMAFEKVGMFDETMHISADFDMWVRIARYFPIGFVKKHLIALRDHTGQLSRNEKYYINHVREDLKVYRYLQSYISSSIWERGKRILRKRKLVFYYTLMVKTFLKGNFRIAGEYFSLLSKQDNIALLTVEFVKAKLF